jgi:hypothetical protein
MAARIGLNVQPATSSLDAWALLALIFASFFYKNLF